MSKQDNKKEDNKKNNATLKDAITDAAEKLQKELKLTAIDAVAAKEAQEGLTQSQVIAVDTLLGNEAVDNVIVYPDNSKAVIREVVDHELIVESETGKALPAVKPGDVFVFLRYSAFQEALDKNAELTEKILSSKDQAPNSPGTETEGVTTQESKSGESAEHTESMKGKHGTEKRSKQGPKKLSEEDKNTLPPVVEQNGQSETKASDFKKNKSGESHLKAEREKGDQGLH